MPPAGMSSPQELADRLLSCHNGDEKVETGALATAGGRVDAKIEQQIYACL